MFTKYFNYVLVIYYCLWCLLRAARASCSHNSQDRTLTQETKTRQCEYMFLISDSELSISITQG